MSTARIVALLGRRDEPTDGVRDYCSLLSQAFARRGQSLEVAELRWDSLGWIQAIRRLWRDSQSWAGDWVLFQYTALMWSRRGFPFGALAALWILKLRGVRLCAVFHDVNANPGSSFWQRLRVAFQTRTMRTALRLAERSVLTVPLEQVSWLRENSKGVAFIPVGSNFPQILHQSQTNGVLPSVPIVAVFGISSGAAGNEEIADIAYVMKSVWSQGIRIRLATIGRGTTEAEPALRRALMGPEIDLMTLGLMPVEDLARTLAGADVLLCVRGHVSSRRGSAIAGIVSGLPIVGYRGEETGFPITEAGVMLANTRDRETLVQLLTQVLRNENLNAELQRRSRAAAEQYFCWDSIAAEYARVLAE